MGLWHMMVLTQGRSDLGVRLTNKLVPPWIWKQNLSLRSLHRRPTPQSVVYKLCSILIASAIPSLIFFLSSSLTLCSGLRGCPP